MLNRLSQYVVILGVMLCVIAGALHAQTGPNYSTWAKLAGQAQDLIADDGTTSEQLTDIRVRLVEWRQQFQNAQTLNQGQIETVQGQISALGTAPEDETAENKVISDRRNALNDELTALRAPVLQAEEALQKANGMIAQIDHILRERQAAQLLSRGPTPLNPAIWPAAIETGSATLFDLITQSLIPADKTVTYQTRVERLPEILSLLIIGALLIIRGPGWAALLGNKARKATRHGTGVWGFVISFGQMVLSLAGLTAITEGIVQFEFLGELALTLLYGTVFFIALLFAVRWLIWQVLPLDTSQALLPLPAEHHPSLRRLLMWMTVLALLRLEVALIIEKDDWPPSVEVVFIFPIIVLLSFVLYRISTLFSVRPSAKNANAENNEAGFRNYLLRTIGRVLFIIALAAPLAAAVGYYNAAIALVFPAAESLLFLGILLVLQNFLADVYVLITRKDSNHKSSLIPTLIGFCLSFVAVPVLALMWGARWTDLTELWQKFVNGFALGSTKISPSIFLTFLLVFAIGYMITRMLQGALRTTVLPKTRLDIGGQNAIVVGLGYLGIFVSALVAVTTAGLDLSGLAIVAGALSVGIGFGLQNVVSNFVSGIILLIERPISEGDWIEVGGQMGYVRNISVRSTRIETFDRTDVIVPNADLVSGTVTNYTHGNLVGRAIVPVRVAHGADTRQVEQILREIADAHPMILADPEPVILFQGFATDCLMFELRAILRDVNWVLSIKSDVNHEIARRFAEAGIEIPIARQDIWLRNPEALQPPQS